MQETISFLSLSKKLDRNALQYVAKFDFSEKVCDKNHWRTQFLSPSLCARCVGWNCLQHKRNNDLRHLRFAFEMFIYEEYRI